GRVNGTQPLHTQTTVNNHHAVSSAGAAAAWSAAETPAAAAAAKRAARTAAFGQVLRSKGFAWVSGRDEHVGEWSSAGNLMRFGTGGPWYDVLPREAWPSEPDKVAAIEKDFLPGVGDRRQELVFIGIDMLRDQLIAALEDCLATPAEEAELKKLAVAAAAAAEIDAMDGAAGKKSLRAPCVLDPFLPWPDIQDIMDAGDDDDGAEEEDDDAEQEEEEEEDEEEDEDVEDGVEEEAEGEEEGEKGEDGDENDDDGPVGRWEPGVVLEDISDGAAELQALLDETEQPAVVVLWHAPWAAASREAEAGLAALAVRHPQLVFVRLDVAASQANEALAVSGCRLMALPASRRSDARPTLKDGSKWPAFTLHRPPGLQHEAFFAGPTALAELRSELLRRQPDWEGVPRTVPARGAVKSAAAEADQVSSVSISSSRSSAVALVAAAAVSTTSLGGGDATLLRRRTTDSIPATPAKPTVSVPVVTVPAAAVAPPSSSSISSVQQRQPQLQPRVSELRRGAADLKAHLQEARDAGCPLVVTWLGAPPPNYPSTPTTSVPSAASGGSAAATTTLSTPPPAAARRAAVQHHSVPPPPSCNQQDGATLELLELSEQDQAALRVDVAAACKQYGAAVRMLFADPGASAANRALAEALRVAAAPTLQVYADMKMARSLKGAAAVSKLAAALLEVAAPLPLPSAGAAAAAAAAVAAMTSQSVEMSPSASSQGGPAGASEPPLLSQVQSSIYDPPSGKYGKPGARKQFGPRGRGVFWPRMPCLRCGCPWWLGEDWDAECVRCGWDCEADGYDDDSNPLPAFKAKYDAFTAALREGRTPVWRGKHVGPRG
ncbi:hypothetical protein Vretimale_8602, partial [Volvox reticuliferus]